MLKKKVINSFHGSFTVASIRWVISVKSDEKAKESIVSAKVESSAEQAPKDSLHQ